MVQSPRLEQSLHKTAPPQAHRHGPGEPADLDMMAYCLGLLDDGGSVIFAEQIRKEVWPKMFVIDGCDAVPFVKGHIPVTVSLERRQILA